MASKPHAAVPLDFSHASARKRRWAGAWEFIVERIVIASGALTVLVVLLIFAFLLKDSAPLFYRYHYPLKDLLTAHRWLPISDPPTFGILPLLAGSLLVTVGATVLALPMGVACAAYIAEIASPRVREFLKPTVEMLAAIPSVVLGFIGLLILAPALKSIFHLPTGQTALAGSLMLALMALPTVVSVAEDAITSVPRVYRNASLALGATPLQTIWRVTLPAARSGIIAAVMLGVGRAVGETMTVMMITGNAGVLTGNPLRPVRTMTATIAAEMGEASHFSDHYCALFALGAMLFLITFSVNLIADVALQRGKRRGTV